MNMIGWLQYTYMIIVTKEFIAFLTTISVFPLCAAKQLSFKLILALQLPYVGISYMSCFP